jgi:DHA1 family tetracycline resistance protein-like MFS transporter
MMTAGLARSGAAYFISIPVTTLWSVSGPASQSMMSQRVSHSAQGELQGAVSSLRAIASIIGPSLFAFSFAYCVNPAHGWTLPGLPWYLAGALLLLAAVLSMRVQTAPDDFVQPTAPEAEPVVPPSV